MPLSRRPAGTRRWPSSTARSSTRCSSRQPSIPCPRPATKRRWASDLTDIFEVRRLVEVPMAELAARRADPEQRAEIKRIARTFKVSMTLDEFRAADHDFHATVAKACGNPSLAELYGKVLDALFKSTDFDSLLSASENEAVVRRVIRDATKAHREIAASLCAGDVEAVRKAAEGHLEQVEALMVAQMT